MFISYIKIWNYIILLFQYELFFEKNEINIFSFDRIIMYVLCCCLQ